ncbi:MAG: hypothetical protein EAZ97_07050 [Bacteroidetes bacterium]|nr:MAG: hypothetical protein EAZ97_07050 [Bacteroidota bacterium]
MKALEIKKLSRQEKQCVLYFAVLPSKPEPILNLSEYFLLGRDFVDDLLDCYQENTYTKSFFGRVRRMIGDLTHITFQLLVYEKLNAPNGLQKTLDSLVQKGWLLEENKMYQMPENIQQIALKNMKVRAKNLVLLLDGFSKRIAFHSSVMLHARLFYMPYCEHLLKTLHEDHALIAKLSNMVGRIYMFLGDHEKAIYFQLRDVRICEKLFPNKHLDLGFCYAMMAIYYYYSAEYKNAKFYIEKSADIFQRNLPQDNEDLQNALAWKNDIYEAYNNDK